MTLPFFRLGAGDAVPAGGRPGRWSRVFGPTKIDPAAGVPHLTVERPAPEPRGQRRRQALWFPLPLPSKVAVLESGFETGRNIRSFEPQDGAWTLWAPDVLVLPLPVALLLADQKQTGLRAIPELTVAVVVLSSAADGPLSEAQRDRLWRVFRVPVFEQLRAADGTVIARECEVHYGLHVDIKAAEVECDGTELLIRRAGPGTWELEKTGLTGEVLRGCCECGAETPRLVDLARMQTEVAAASGR